MSDLRDLYQEIILDHSKKPRNHRELGGAAHHAAGHNPLCGDRVKVFVRLEGDVVAEATFVGSGCAISTASASLMTDMLKGRTKAEAKRLAHNFFDLVRGLKLSSEEIQGLGKLSSFSGVCAYPVRVKCATLAWHTLSQALDAGGDALPLVSTE
jgi:nitrogen fixation NifU-like protein